MMHDYLLFRIGERLFGVTMQGAVEIVPWRRARPVPLAYSYVEGLLDYRGVLYPVFHLPTLLGLSPAGPIGFTAKQADPPPGRSIILLREGDKPFGITVDTVLRMARLDDAERRPPEAKGLNPQLLQGLQFMDDLEIILLSFERLFHAG